MLNNSKYLYDELRAGNVELLRGQDPLRTVQVLQDHSQVDQVVSHHVLILHLGDLLLNHLDWKYQEQKDVTT